MALDRMSVEEIQQLLEEALKLQAEDIQQYGYVTEDTKKRLKDAQAGIRNYTNTLKQSWQSLKSSAWETVKSAGESAKGASQYNDVLTKGATHIRNKLAPTGILGQAAGAVIEMAAAYVSATAKQADDLFKSYQTASRAGVIGSGGITELYSNMQKFGYGVGELGNLETILAANSKNLAMLRGTAVDGTKAFADLSQSIRDSQLGVQLQYMGNSVDSINTGLAGYLRLQTLTGEGQRQTQEQLRAGAEEYLVATEKLTKMTGMAADEQLSVRESALEEQRWGAYIEDLRQKQLAAEERGDLETAEKFRKRRQDEQDFNVYLKNKFGKETAQGYRNIATGFRNDKTAVKFQNTYGTAVQSIDRLDDIPVIADKMRDDARRNLAGGKELYKAGLAQNTFIAFNEQQRARNLQDYSKSLEEATNQIDVQDDTTKNLGDLAINQRKTRNDLQDLLLKGIKPVTGGFEMLAKAMGKVPGVASAAATKVTGGAGGTPGSAASQATPAGNQATAAQAKGGAPSSSGAPAPGTTKTSPAKAAESTGGGWLRELLGLPKAVGTGVAAKGAGSLAAIRDLISQVESENVGGYNALWGGKTADLTNMTISEVLNLQSTMSGSTAVGRYQTIKSTLLEVINALQINPMTTKFDQGIQDRIADYLIQNRGYADYQSGKITKEQFLHNLSRTWAGLPSGPEGKSFYDRVGQNKAHIDWTTALASLATGGIASGPAGGYRATLHGTEAVVPLPEKGKGIPVNTDSFGTMAQDRVGMFAEQLEKFDRLMLAMQKHVDISNKILQQAQ